MKESDLTATMTLKFVSEGEGAVVAGLKAVGAEQEKAAAAAAALAAATENAAKRQVSAAAAFDALARRMDPAARAFADLERNQNDYNRALAANSSIVDKAGQGLDVYAAKLKAAEAAASGLLVQQENMRRQQSNLTTNVSPTNASTSTTTPNLNSTSALEAEYGRLMERLAAYEAALAKGKISQAAFDAEQERSKTSLIEYDNWLNTTTKSVENLNRQKTNFSSSANPTQITGTQLSNVNVRDYAAQFEAAAAAQDEMVAAATRLRAALDPLAVEEERVAAKLGVLKSSLEATLITQQQYAAAVATENQGLAAFAEKLNAAAVAAENLRRQQANASVNQGQGFNPSTANTSTYAAQFEAAAAAQDAMAASAARLRATLDPLGVEQQKVAEKLGVLKGALNATMITQSQYDAAVLLENQGLAAFAEKLNVAAVAAENLRRQQANASVNQGQGFNPASANTNTYAAQFEAAAAAQDAMIASTSRLRAELNPLEVEQGRLASELSVYKTALDAGRISQSLYAAEQAKAGQALADYADKLNSAATAAEHLRRQQSNLSTNTTVQGPTNPTQITGTQLSNVNVRDYAVQFEAAAAAQDAMAASTTRLVAALNPFEAEQGRLATQLSEYKAALDAGRISQQVYTAEQEKAGQTLAAYAEKLNSAAMAAENLRRQNSNLSTNTTVAGPANPTQITGTKLSNVNTSEYAAQFEAAAKAQDEMVAASNRLKAALNPLAVEEAKQVQELGLLKQAMQSGIISQEQFAGAQQLSVTRLANLAQSLKTAGTAGRVMSGEMTNLGFQLNDVVTGLALGQSPFMILGQQGGQIIQIFANSKSSIADFASSSVRWLTSLITPMTATIAGAVAAAAAIAALAAQYDKLQVSSQRALIGAGERTGTTVSDLNKFVEQNSGSFAGGNMTTGLSNKESRALAEDLTKTGEIVISKLHGMSDAVVGFANQTGQSMDDARKAFVGFAVDPKKGMEELAKVFGDFDVPTRLAVDDLVRLNDKTAATNVVLDSVAEKAKKAAENMGLFEMAARGAGNVLAKETVKPSGLEAQFDKVKNELNAAIEAPADILNTPGSSKNIELLSQKLAELQQAIEKVKPATAAAEINKLSTAADGVVNSIIPEIAQIDQLRTKLEALDQLKAKGGASKQGAEVDTAARIELQNVISKTEEAQAATARYNQEVAAISISWGNVGTETALALNALQQQASVAAAVTGQQQMAAQAAADFANFSLQGKTELEAEALAAAKLAVSEAAATAAVDKQIDALKDSTAMIKAQQNGTEATTKAAIAYKTAIESGADATSAAALKAETLKNSIAQAGGAAETLAGAFDRANQSLNNFNAGLGQSLAQSQALAQNAMSWQQAQSLGQQTFTNSSGQTLQSPFDPVIMPGGTLTFAGDPTNPISYKYGGNATRRPSLIDTFQERSFLNTGAQTQSADQVANYALSGGIDNAINTVKNSGLQDAAQTISSLYDLKNSMTNDNAAKAANLQEEMGWLQTQPQTIARDQTIVNLQQSIDQLKSSTDDLNSTMGDLLSPYYTQDPRTSHIGFRSQGMASGGEFTVPGGYSSNDNMVGQIPLASGEIVSVRRPGESSGGAPIIIHQNITIQGSADRDEVRRTQYHNGQNLARQLRASSS